MVYLIPSFLSENAVETIPPYVMDAVRTCDVIFAENIRTARRFLKRMDQGIVIDDFQWFEIHKVEEDLIADFKKKVLEKRHIAIISEAGCPGVADPGQVLVSVAQQMGVKVKPLVGPSSILLALMASGMNGQRFSFHGYLPIESGSRIKKIRQLEEESFRLNCTQIFIETPYRNDALIKEILDHCHPETLLCIAADITSANESIQTKSVNAWRATDVRFHKHTVIYLLLRQLLIP